MKTNRSRLLLKLTNETQKEAHSSDVSRVLLLLQNVEKWDIMELGYLM